MLESHIKEKTSRAANIILQLHSSYS